MKIKLVEEENIWRSEDEIKLISSCVEYVLSMIKVIRNKDGKHLNIVE